MATKFDPMPDPSTPMQNPRSLVTPVSYSHPAQLNKPQVQLITLERKSGDVF
jgi:hypothetical protein